MMIEMDIAAREPVKDFVFGIGVFNSMGVMCYGTNTHLEEYESVRPFRGRAGSSAGSSRSP